MGGSIEIVLVWIIVVLSGLYLGRNFFRKAISSSGTEECDIDCGCSKKDHSLKVPD
jgi:hypothetical protein